MKPHKKPIGEKIAKADTERCRRQDTVEAVCDLVEIDHPARQIGAFVLGERSQRSVKEWADQEHRDYLQHGLVPRYAAMDKHHAEDDESKQHKQRYAASANNREQQKADRGDADEVHRSTLHQVESPLNAVETAFDAIDPVGQSGEVAMKISGQSLKTPDSQSQFADIVPHFGNRRVDAIEPLFQEVQNFISHCISSHVRWSGARG